MLKKYLVDGTTKCIVRKGRPVNINNRQLKDLVKIVNNKTGISPY